MSFVEPAPITPPTRPDDTVAAVLAAGAVRTVFQPLVHLDSREVVGYEALARGPRGPLEAPDALFAAARADGLLFELDAACRAAAFRGAAEHGIVAPHALFVNVEPEVLDAAPLEELLEIAQDVPGSLRVVVEITERALAARPAELLRTVERVRELGWLLALDDVGAESSSLAFMSLLCPDVVKLDLSLVQQRPSRAVAEIMNAVNAYAERSGALVLAEGIETEAHLRTALGLGATLGQGWLFGRPVGGRDPERPSRSLELAADLRGLRGASGGSPFGCLPEGFLLRQASKRLLIELTKQIEAEALRLGPTSVVASTFQRARHFTPATRDRYVTLASGTGFVCALGEDMPLRPATGVRGARLATDDPVLGEWDVVVISPHFSVALLARDLGDTGPEMDRTFEYALTYRRDTVTHAARELLSRVAPRRTRSAEVRPLVAQPSTAPPPAPATRRPSRSSSRSCGVA